MARVGLVGLGSMGLGMALNLHRKGHETRGCDVSEVRRAAFAAEGGAVATRPDEAAAGADALVMVVATAAQAEAVLFGVDGAAAALPQGAVVIGCSTVPADFAVELAERLTAADLLYLDAPISGGADGAAKGELTVMAAGSEAAFARAQPVLDAVATTVFRCGETPGQGSSVKIINQLLAGVHIAAACEAMTLAIRQGLDPKLVYEVICRSAGRSWMFENRVPRLMEGDWRARSAVDIFVKDLGIVQDTARGAAFPAPLSAAALQMFLAASGAGMGRDDDSSVARVYARLSGVTLPNDPPANDA